MILPTYVNVLAKEVRFKQLTSTKPNKEIIKRLGEKKYQLNGKSAYQKRQGIHWDLNLGYLELDPECLASHLSIPDFFVLDYPSLINLKSRTSKLKTDPKNNAMAVEVTMMTL